MSKDWNVDAYKNEHESLEHWELRKKFLLTYKDKFPEDELICLAQVFANIEFLGCRYPDQTMIRVAELAKGVVDEYRELRKNSLKRTFVSASDAASAKMKGHSSKNDNCGPPSKKRALNESENSDIEVITIEEKAPAETNSNQPNARIPKYGGVKTFNINPEKQAESIISNRSLGNFVLFLTAGEEHSVNDIHRSAAINWVVPKWDFEEGAGKLKVCKLYFNNQFIATGVGENLKNSKENTAIAAVAKLRESHFAIKVKSKFFSNTVVGISQLNSVPNNNSATELGEDNIGRKLMKLMGWEGGGLGKNEQGIEEPIAAGLQVQREGLGLIKNDSNAFNFRNKVRDYVENWMNSETNNDLVFSTEFNTEERKVIHEVAKQFSLKSKSYGKDNNRHLVVSRKSEPWEIVEALKKQSGSSDKYELLYPTKGN